MTDRAVVLDTPDSIELFRLLSMRGRLRLELKGYRFRVPTVPAVNKTLGTNFRKREKALAALEAHIAEITKPLTEDPL